MQSNSSWQRKGKKELGTALKCVPMNSTFLKRDIKSVITKCDHISNLTRAKINECPHLSE